MNGEAVEQNDLNVIQKIIGIFSSPTETFKSIDKKPTWIIPFILLILVVLVTQFLSIDITMADQKAAMASRDLTDAQLNAATARMDGPMKYVGLIGAPIAVLIVWVIIAGVFLFAGNVIMGGKTKFKSLMAVVSWSSLIGLVQLPLTTFLIMSKGTRFGVTTSLAALLPAQEIGAKTPLLHVVLKQFDIFIIWQLVLWILGISVVYKFTLQKSATMVITIWAIYAVVSIGLGQLVAGML